MGRLSNSCCIFDELAIAWHVYFFSNGQLRSRNPERSSSTLSRVVSSREFELVRK